jgi:hypothetical protein
MLKPTPNSFSRRVGRDFQQKGNKISLVRDPSNASILLAEKSNTKAREEAPSFTKKDYVKAGTLEANVSF